MHLRHVVEGRYEPGADRPHRLVGNRNGPSARFGRHGLVDLPTDDAQGFAAVAFGSGFPDADDREKIGARRRFGLGPNDRIRLGVTRPTFGMADDHQRCPCVFQHFSRNVTRMGARRQSVAILPAEEQCRPALTDLGGGGQQRERRTNRDIGPSGGPARHRVPESGDHGQRAPRPVHLPISGDQGAQSGHRFKFSCSIEARITAGYQTRQGLQSPSGFSERSRLLMVRHAVPDPCRKR